MLKYNHGEKCIKVRFVIYVDSKSLLTKIDTRYNNPEKSSTVKLSKHTSCGYTLFTHRSFVSNKKKIISLEVNTL